MLCIYWLPQLDLHFVPNSNSPASSTARTPDDVISIIRALAPLPFCSVLPPAALAIVCRDISVKLFDTGDKGAHALSAQSARLSLTNRVSQFCMRYKCPCPSSRALLVCAVFTTGDRSDMMYIVLAGSVSVHVRIGSTFRDVYPSFDEGEVVPLVLDPGSEAA